MAEIVNFTVWWFIEAFSESFREFRKRVNLPKFVTGIKLIYTTKST